MDILEDKLIELFNEEHQDWVGEIKRAERDGDGVDVNLGGKFAKRLTTLMKEIRDFGLRHTKPKKKGFFG